MSTAGEDPLRRVIRIPVFMLGLIAFVAVGAIGLRLGHVISLYLMGLFLAFCLGGGILALGLRVGLKRGLARRREQDRTPVVVRAVTEDFSSGADPTATVRAYSKWARNLVMGGITLLAVAIALLALSIRLYDEDPYGTPSVVVVLLFVVWINFLAGCFAIAGGVAGLFRGRRLQQIVAGHAWVRVSCRHRVVPDGLLTRGLVALEPDTSAHPTVLTVGSQWPWRRLRAGLDGATRLDYAGELSKQVVVRVPGNKTLLSARPAGCLGADPRWRKALGLASER
jgi:hypothetical protein